MALVETNMVCLVPVKWMKDHVRTTLVHSMYVLHADVDGLQHKVPRTIFVASDLH
jgi:hypothetical protein